MAGIMKTDRHIGMITVCWHGQKEVYDPQTDAWYWFEADGTMARDKDVFIVLNADGTGKWTRYDSDGRMVKGESSKTGSMVLF